MDFELSGQVISGVGNEVMAFGVAVMLFVIPVFISIYRNIYRFNGDFDDLPLPDIGNETEHMIPSVVFNRDICPICLSTPELAVETCCGHYYCGLCLRECSNFATSTLIKCPLCRKPVTLLFVCFTMLELERQEQEAEKDRVYAFVSTYNRNCSHIRRTLGPMLQCPVNAVQGIRGLTYWHILHAIFTLGGVDHQDHVLACFPVMRRYTKRYKTIFFYLLDMALFKSYASWKKLSGKRSNYTDFCLNFIEQLLESVTLPASQLQGCPSNGPSLMWLQAKKREVLC